MAGTDELDEEFDPHDDVPTTPEGTAVEFARLMEWMANVFALRGMEDLSQHMREGVDMAREYTKSQRKPH